MNYPTTARLRSLSAVRGARSFWPRLFGAAVLGALSPILALRLAAANQWSGSVEVKLDLDDTNTSYSRHETQTWTLTGGAPIMSGSIALYPAKWHYTGVGTAAIGALGQAALINWTIEATHDVQVAIFVRASDHQLTFHQWTPPSYVADALSYTGQSVNSGGGPPTTGTGKSGVYEWVFPWIIADPAATDVSGPITALLSAPSFAVPLNYAGNVQPTITGTWHFTVGSGGGQQVAGPSLKTKLVLAAPAINLPRTGVLTQPKGGSNAPPAPKPAQDPANFTAAQTGEGQVQLNWNAVTGVTTYLVLGPGSANGGNASDGLKLQNTTVTLTGVPAGAQQWLVTSWYDPDGSRTTAANWPKADLTVVAPKNHYRITATHVLINHEEPDDGMKLHGKDNEIFVTSYADVFDRRNKSSITSGPILRTPIHGDTNNSDPNKGIRIQAGTVSGTGGIQTGDDVQIWMWDFTSPSRWPLVVWEGDLTDGVEVVVLRPMVWAVGGGEQRFWTPYSNRILYNEHPADVIALPEVNAALGQTSGISVDTASELTTSGNYTVYEERPIGMALTSPQQVVGSVGGLISSSTEGMPAVWSDRIIVLTREKVEAFLAGQSARTLQVRVTGHTGDGGSLGDYTLFLGIEKM